MAQIVSTAAEMAHEMALEEEPSIAVRTNSASHFEFKLRERAPWDGDKNLRGARTKRGKKVAKGLRLK